MSNDRITSEKQNNTGVLADISQNWLDMIQRHLKETSYIKYRNLLYNHILPELGTTYLSGLSTLQVEAFVRKKLKEGRKDQRGGLKEKTVKGVMWSSIDRFSTQGIQFVFSILGIVCPR